MVGVMGVDIMKVLTALTLYQQMQNRHSKIPCDFIPDIKKVNYRCAQASVCLQNLESKRACVEDTYCTCGYSAGLTSDYFFPTVSW